MFSIVRNACWMRWVPSSRATENCLHVMDSKMVGNSVVFSLQMWDTETAAEVRKASVYCV